MRRSRTTGGSEKEKAKNSKNHQTSALNRSITEVTMADVAPPGLDDRRNASTESPAKYAGNEDGERSDDDHRGKVQNANLAGGLVGKGDRARQCHILSPPSPPPRRRSEAFVVGAEKSLPVPDSQSVEGPLLPREELQQESVALAQPDPQQKLGRQEEVCWAIYF